MKKVWLLAFSFFFIVLLLSGCTDAVIKTDATTKDGTSSQQFDAGTLADLIYSNTKFDDMMTKVPSASVIKIYGLPSEYCGDCAIYVSTGATPEELAVFEVNDSCTADVIIEATNARIAKQTEGYSSYAPKEVPKLDSAVVYSGSGFVVVCVSADNAAAAEFIKDYI